MNDADNILAEIKRRATHFDSTGYITVHEDALRGVLAETRDVEVEWLRRLLRWCRPRLKHASYQTRLDESIARGPTVALEDEPPMAALSATPLQEPTE